MTHQFVNQNGTFFVANVTLLPLERNNSRDDIECPGDTISYSCLVHSNSENILLRWLITFPGQDSMMVVYTNFSDAEIVTFLDMNVTTRVINNRFGNFIESMVVLTVLQNVSMNGTLVECMSEDLGSEVARVYVRIAG